MQNVNSTLEEFARLLRKNLEGLGIDGQLFDNALEITVRQLQETSPEEASIALANLLKREENRCMDSLGRILVEYCFIKTPETPLVWPENSVQDSTARKIFTPEVLPRPLMRYFLATVRGSITGLDRFEAASILSKSENNTHEHRKEHVNKLIQEFKGPFGSGESAIRWEAVYSDGRFREITLELIRDIRRTLEKLDLQQYLVILDNYREIDPDSTGLNAMLRPFSIEDAKQIEKALCAAEKTLARVAD
jgi:hypothetical protein